MKKIGKLKIEPGAFLAPMADYTNVAFRTLCKEYGSSLTYTELISVKGLLYKNKKTEKMLSVSKKEKPVFLQLFGNNPIDFEDAIKKVESTFPTNFAGYDLNCGCSVKKAFKGKYGCALMTEPKTIGKIIESMKSVTQKPITIKMRLGFEKENFIEVVKEAEEKGADAITLHARLGSQGYGGNADWSAIKKLKDNVKIPVIGNGDIQTVDDYKKIKKETNCDFVMVGRAAIGNAFIFKQIKQFESGKKISQKNNIEVFEEGSRYLDLAKEFDLGVNDVRGYFIGLANNFKGAKELRAKFGLSKSIDEILLHFNEFFN